MSRLSVDHPIRFNRISDPVISEKKVTLDIARLDEIDPYVSGNKIFKLHQYINKLPPSCNTVVTKGGPFSNHLVATASFCFQNGLHAVGLVRGEDTGMLTHTLQQCKNFGMNLIFISRSAYSKIDDSNYNTCVPYLKGSSIFINEGGFGIQGCNGASLIMNKIAPLAPTHIATAVGTATTLAGLLKAANEEIAIIGFSILKGITDIPERLSVLLEKAAPSNYMIAHDYHFGGYAKYNNELIDFMNSFYKNHKIPLDFVYTGKMMFGLMNMIKDDYFPSESHIVALHTGGLQGNCSLPVSLLDF